MSDSGDKLTDAQKFAMTYDPNDILSPAIIKMGQERDGILGHLKGIVGTVIEVVTGSKGPKAEPPKSNW